MMMQARSYQYLTAFFLAILLFNFSIDPVDKPGPENLSVNEIESFLEFVIENILDQGNVLPETDEGDENSGRRESAAKFLCTHVYIELTVASEIQSVRNTLYRTSFFNSLSTAIITPPPRA